MNVCCCLKSYRTEGSAASRATMLLRFMGSSFLIRYQHQCHRYHHLNRSNQSPESELTNHFGLCGSFKYLDVIDLHRPRDLHHDLIEKSVLISAFTGQTAQIDKNADIAPDL